MQHIVQGNRHQIDFSSLDCRIAADNPVRFIDAFADKLDLPLLQFETTTINTEGRPSFDRKLFLKVYIYSYINGIANRANATATISRNIAHLPASNAP